MPLPRLAELIGLEQSALYRLSPPEPAASVSGFGPQSAPYLWASEFPGTALEQIRPELASPAVCVAGSGDIAVELLRLALWPLVAVDVSRPACYVNELKAAALAAGLSRQQYLGLLPAPPSETLALLAPRLSEEARGWWWQQAVGGGPEGASLLDARPNLPGLVYLSDEGVFDQLKSSVPRWPLLNLSLEDFMATIPDQFGTIYVSNVGEYIQRSLLLAERDGEVPLRLLQFYLKVASRLLPGGLALAYVFEPEGRARSGAEAAAMARAGLGVSTYGVEFGRFATTFRHCLLAGRRP